MKWLKKSEVNSCELDVNSIPSGKVLYIKFPPLECEDCVCQVCFLTNSHFRACSSKTKKRLDRRYDSLLVGAKADRSLLITDIFCSLTKRIRRTVGNLQKVNKSFTKKDAHHCKEGVSCTCAIGAIRCIHFICSGLVHQKFNSKFCSLGGVTKLTIFCSCAPITCFHDMKLKTLLKMNKILATIFCNIYPEHISRLFVCFIFCYALIKQEKSYKQNHRVKKNAHLEILPRAIYTSIVLCIFLLGKLFIYEYYFLLSFGKKK